MMTKEGSTKIVNFMTHGAGSLVLGHRHISHKVIKSSGENVLFLLKSSSLLPDID